MRFPRNSVSECSRCTGGLLGSTQASLRLYLLPAFTLQSAGAWPTAQHTSRKPQIRIREHTQHFHVVGGAVLTILGLTVNVLRCQSVPSLPFPDLWVDPE